MTLFTFIIHPFSFLITYANFLIEERIVTSFVVGKRTDLDIQTRSFSLSIDHFISFLFLTNYRIYAYRLSQRVNDYNELSMKTFTYMRSKSTDIASRYIAYIWYYLRARRNILNISNYQGW